MKLNHGQWQATQTDGLPHVACRVQVKSANRGELK